MEPEDLAEFLIPILAPTYRDIDASASGKLEILFAQSRTTTKIPCICSG